LPSAKPQEVGFDPELLGKIEPLILQAIEQGKTPSAVVVVGREGKVAYRKGFNTPVETPYDLASLTKPIATATSIGVLIEQGKVSLSDPVSKHLPSFATHGKDKITIEQLLLHTSGLPAGTAVADYSEGKEKAWEKIDALKLANEPGSKFLYSDVGFLLLGRLVEKLSGQGLDVFAAKHIFQPAGLKEFTFMAPKNAALTQGEAGKVHDPRSRALGGVTGHAGLFASADAVATFGQMLLDGGVLKGKRILKEETVTLLTTPRPVPGGLRSYGWDVKTGFSAPRGDRFGGFGHTGFTGTSIWVDPQSRTIVVLLTNRVHPDGKGNVTALRRELASLVARSINKAPLPGPRESTLCGIDVLKREGFKRLAGKKIALVTNHTGLDATGTATIDLLHSAKDVKLLALFSPEHGIRGLVDAAVPDSKDEKTGLPIYSLYGKRKKPTKDLLKDVDTIVYDIQDIGCRFYTYISTLGLIMETAAENNLELIVLDRPNPIGGVLVEGPTLEKAKESFVAYHSIPIRHGMTVGELALLFNKERKIGAKLEVVKVENWRREQLFDETGLSWVNPSPNMRSLLAALTYPGVGLLETTNVSVGRGTDRPFELIGAPWVDGRKLAEALNEAGLKGVRFVGTKFTPTSSTHAKKECGGVQIYITNWSEFEAMPLGWTLVEQLRRLYPKEWEWKRYNVLLGHQGIFDAIEKGPSVRELSKLSEPGRKAFLEVRRRYLLY
jgi:uncharacterized protein YbbC (DUF1343 family)